MAKTHRSPDFYEFAKRYFHKNKEFTHFPFSALKESASRYYRLVDLLQEQRKRGWVSSASVPENISSYYGQVEHRPSKYRKTMFDRSYVCERVLNSMRNPLVAAVSVNEIIGYLGYSIRPLKNEECLGILSSIAVEMFADSNPENDKGKGKPLGLLAEELILHFTSLMDTKDGELGFKLCNAFPLLGLYGLVEEQFMNLKREAREIDTKRAGD